MKLNKDVVLNENFNLNLKTFKKVNKADKQDEDVLKKLVTSNYSNWNQKQRIKFFNTYPKALGYLSEIEQVEFLSKENLKFLSESLQKRAILENEENLKFVSTKIQAESIIENNARATLFEFDTLKDIVSEYKNVLECLPEHIQIDICKANNKMIRYANMIVQDKVISINPGLFKYATVDYKAHLADISTYDLSKLTKDCIKMYAIQNQEYTKEKFEILLNGLYKIKKQRRLIETLVKYTDINFITNESLEIFLKCHPNRRFRRIRRSKVWRKIKKNL